MSIPPCPNGDREDDSEPCPAQHPTQETECTCLTERLPQELRRTGYPALNDIRVFIRDSVVTLEGRVASYHQKQLAQEAVRRVFGHAIIRNELEIAGRNER